MSHWLIRNDFDIMINKFVKLFIILYYIISKQFIINFKMSFMNRQPF